MNRSDLLRSLKKGLSASPKILFFYILAPCIILRLLADPIGSAVLRSDGNAFLILLLVFAAVALNWLVYSRLRRKAPSHLVFAWGFLWLLFVVIIESEAFPAVYPLVSTLAVIGGVFTLAALFLISFWLAARRARAAHTAAVVIWVVLFLVFCAMCYQVIRDIESRSERPDTWIILATIILMLLTACSPSLLTAARRSASRRRKTGLAEGKITQIIGETRLDMDGDPSTRNYARIQYTVSGIPYETRADISRITTRRFGKEAFTGKAVPVHYDPSDPSEAFASRIDRHIFDQDADEKRKLPPDQRR